jgi:FMN-dependent oxidoreductase (nitrilotriacetate monooxygenase family)
VLGVLAGVTSRIGLGATYSTTYYPPYHVARTFATLDHLSKGRVAWNVVTSVNNSEAQNFGAERHLGPKERYDRADDFMEAVTGLWDSWDDDALILDRDGGVFADPAKVHELNYRGAYFHVRGPLTVPRSPQGRPLVMQAGSSGRGRDFAARWAELIFTGDPSLEVARSHYADQKRRIAELGRDPASVKICPMAYIVTGESAAQAEEREQMFLHGLVDPMASLTLLSELMNYDFSAHSLDDEVTDELVNSTTGIRGLVENLKTHIGGRVLIRDLAAHRATLLQGPRFVGTPKRVADQMEEWFTSGACDGFVLAATHFPGAFEDVVRMVIPELRRRGLFRTEYTGTTLRDHLGLTRPESSLTRAGAGA